MFDAIQQDDSIDPFYEIAHNKPKESYNPYIDIILGDFVLVHPLDISIHPVWMDRALTYVKLDRYHPYFDQFQSQYWRPRKGGEIIFK